MGKDAEVIGEDSCNSILFNYSCPLIYDCFDLEIYGRMIPLN
jgi:hypothetical protein